MPVLLISGYFTLSDKGALQFVFCCGTRRVYKGLGFLVCINSNTCLNAKLFLRSPNLIACFSHPAFLFYFFFSKIHYSSISSAESCPLLWLYHILLQLCFPNAPNSEGFFIFFLCYISACFSAGDIFHFTGFIRRSPECLRSTDANRSPSYSVFPS